MPVFQQVLNRWAGDVTQRPKVPASRMAAPPFRLTEAGQWGRRQQECLGGCGFQEHLFSMSPGARMTGSSIGCWKAQPRPLLPFSLPAGQEEAVGPENTQSWQWTPGDHSHLGGHSRPGGGLLLMMTLGRCPLPPGIFRRRAAKKVHPPTEESPGRHRWDPCSKLTDTLRYTVGSPMFHFNFFLKMYLNVLNVLQKLGNTCEIVCTIF